MEKPSHPVTADSVSRTDMIIASGGAACGRVSRKRSSVRRLPLGMDNNPLRVVEHAPAYLVGQGMVIHEGAEPDPLHNAFYPDINRLFHCCYECGGREMVSRPVSRPQMKIIMTA